MVVVDVRCVEGDGFGVKAMWLFLLLCLVIVSLLFQSFFHLKSQNETHLDPFFFLSQTHKTTPFLGWAFGKN